MLWLKILRNGMWKAVNKSSDFHWFKCSFHCTLISWQSSLPLLFPQSGKMFVQRQSSGLYIRHDVPLRLRPREPTQRRLSIMISFVTRRPGTFLSQVSESVKKGRSEMLMSLRNVPQIFYTSFSFEDLLSQSRKKICHNSRGHRCTVRIPESRDLTALQSPWENAHNTQHTGADLALPLR